MQHWGGCVLGLILGRPAVKNTLLHRISFRKRRWVLWMEVFPAPRIRTQGRHLTGAERQNMRQCDNNMGLTPKSSQTTGLNPKDVPVATAQA